MKNQYVGDINDYAKYALLRGLSANDELAVAWMLTPDDNRTDGRRIRYLEAPEAFRSLDPPLFDLLDDIVGKSGRNVQSVENGPVLPGAVYVSDMLLDDVHSRDEYFKKVWRVAAGRRILFFDPDNGFEVQSVPRGWRNSSKYLYWDEAAHAYHRGFSLIVYQHFPRRPRAAYMHQLAEKIQASLGCNHIMGALTSHVVFVVVPQPGDNSWLSSRLQALGALSASFVPWGIEA